MEEGKVCVLEYIYVTKRESTREREQGKLHRQPHMVTNTIFPA